MTADAPSTIPVVVGDSEVFYAGSVSSFTWNGWAMPAFPDSEVQRSAAMLVEQARTYPDSELLLHNEASDAWLLVNPEYPAEPEVYARDADGLFPIGAGWWTWEVAA